MMTARACQIAVVIVFCSGGTGAIADNIPITVTTFGCDGDRLLEATFSSDGNVAIIEIDGQTIGLVKDLSDPVDLVAPNRSYRFERSNEGARVRGPDGSIILDNCMYLSEWSKYAG